ncbi:MAG TPA: formimidoylglutamase [Flavobacteriaceae bacterium]|nr:formimidoylglutamase [Flavobacteriaceae bacterium]
MYKLELLTREKVKLLLHKRVGEVKFGEQVQLLSSVSSIYEQLVNLDVSYVIIGLPEDVGVFANYGKSGACNAWDATLKILLNIQGNVFTQPKKVAVLGHLLFTEQHHLDSLKQKSKSDIQKARILVAEIDRQVSALIADVVRAGKIPIVIGGGHNNAYGMIKGTSLALNHTLNIVNLDAHSDFRVKEGRHSGNGFSYAHSEGFLEKYYIFGLHENYTAEAIFNELNKLKNIAYCTYEAMEVKGITSFKEALDNAVAFVSEKPFGIEIDCDAIENIPSSAQTPSGFSVAQTRRFVYQLAKEKHTSYIHICEAAPTKKTQSQVGKLITYLITDFIRARENQ